MFLIVYSKNTGRIRWHTSPGFTSEQIDALVNPLPGEGLLKLDDPQYDNHLGLQEILNVKTGIIPNNDRFVELDKTNTIVAVHLLDPMIDTPPTGHVYVPHPDAHIGWTVTKNGNLHTFTPPLEVTNPKL